ncbi:hypothetical protein IAT38_005069 [Cryptococcus sp. DSM 104549]
MKVCNKRNLGASTTASEATFHQSGISLRNERREVRALERERNELFKSVAESEGFDWKAGKKAYISHRKNVEGVVRHDKQGRNADLLSEWVNSTVDDRSQWGSEPWDRMTSRLEQEKAFTLEARDNLREDIRRLRSRIGHTSTPSSSQQSSGMNQYEIATRRLGQIASHLSPGSSSHSSSWATPASSNPSTVSTVPSWARSTGSIGSFSSVGSDSDFHVVRSADGTTEYSIPNAVKYWK